MDGFFIFIPEVGDWMHTDYRTYWYTKLAMDRSPQDYDGWKIAWVQHKGNYIWLPM